ncbi:alpha/beta fold hydrolase [Pseudalkalibacillus caeni]|uniref:Alpha/beta hydrolase n=1 Tax=Exobacillus caeni TaxID=2574798 RepID=A0A5R9F147_9BACL|nr:alpha/beta fold hydrolase [Pseudalkalibacillus caeni]TLS37287.1 alpha/beta hydrolase [Pseudalkalibacillus caeni]
MIEIVKVDGKHLEVFLKGEGRTVVLQTGMGGSFDEWFEVANALSKKCRVMMYHRPGYGNSNIYEGDKWTTSATVEEINALLEYFGIEEPVIMAGHSYGGLCAQHFAMRYPEKVAGIVLIDSTSFDIHKLDELDLPEMDKLNSDEMWMERCERYSGMSPEELGEEMKPELSDRQKSYPYVTQERLLEFPANPALYRAVRGEMESWKECEKGES